MERIYEHTGNCLSVSPEGRRCVGGDPHYGGHAAWNGGHAAWNRRYTVEKWPTESEPNCLFFDKPAFSFRRYDESTPVQRAALIVKKLK